MSFFYFVFIVLILNINIISAPKVKSVFPASNSLTSEKNTQIIIEFENGIDPSSINDSSFMVWGKWSGVHKGNIVLLENNKKIIFRSNKNFSVGEIITVSLSKKIKDVQSEQMQNGYAWNFWIKPSSTSINLSLKGKINVRKNGESSLQTYGAYAGDLNEDGCGDFFVPNEKSNDARVFINDCSGNYGDFQIFPIPFGDEPSTNEASDFNMDGHIDIAVGNSESRTVSLFFGNGSGGFSSIKNFQADTEVRGLSIIDLDADGLMDIVTANRVGNNISLIKNLGKENFADPVNIEAQGIGETACVSADANNDGIMDLFVGAITSREIILLLGDGNGNLFFSDKVKINGSPWMITAGDVDLDGNLDVVSANSSGNNFSLIKGDGLGKLLTPVNYNAGQFPIAVDLGDIDGDGDLDIAVSNFDSADFTIYENDGSGNYINKKFLSSSSSGSCAVFHDRDNDGDLDMTGIDEIDDLLILFENTGLVDIKNDGKNLLSFELYQNYPNPFNPSTKIKYSISNVVDAKFASTTKVTLKVYDVLGNEIATLVNEEQRPGDYEIEFNVAQNSILSSGVYFYRLFAGSYTNSKKLILLR